MMDGRIDDGWMAGCTTDGWTGWTDRQMDGWVILIAVQ